MNRRSDEKRNDTRGTTELARVRVAMWQESDCEEVNQRGEQLGKGTDKALKKDAD